MKDEHPSSEGWYIERYDTEGPVWAQSRPADEFSMTGSSFSD